MMKLLLLALSAVSASRLAQLAPPDHLEYGFCDGSPEPMTIDNLSVEPFPIIVANGASVTIAAQITLNEVVAAGAQVSLELTLEGIIPIKIPCLEIEGLHIGSW